MIYVLHFDRPFKHARHYVGFTSRKKCDVRIEQHLSGKGSPLVRAVVAEGIEVSVSLTMEGTRTQERAIKNQKNAAFICPICKIGFRKKKTEQRRIQRKRATARIQPAS